MLRDYVDWKKVGIDKVYTARGGKSALVCVSESEPDIILTDIQMPGMSGTELARLIREEGHPCKIIFLTGYEKFEYAKAAVKVQAEDYLLKPFQVEEVEVVVGRVLDKIRQEHILREAEQLAVGRAIEQACTGQADGNDGVFQRRAAGMSFRLLGICGASKEQQQAIRAMPGVIHSFSLESLYIALLLPSVPLRDMANHLLDGWDHDVRIAACRDCAIFDTLREQCSKLLKYQDVLFFGQPKLFLYADNIDHPAEAMPANSVEPPSKLNSLLLYAILDGSVERAAEYLHMALQSFRSGGRNSCLQNAYSLYVYLLEHLKDDSKIYSSPLYDVQSIPLLQSQTYTELEAVFLKYVRICCQAHRESQDNHLLNWVMRYITDYYPEACSVEEIAEGLNLSPNYVRKRFKEATGQTILEYLTEFRLNKAAELLKTSTMKVKDVSVSVGYENIPYFTHLFSKKFGVTPNEYKKPSGHATLV